MAAFAETIHDFHIPARAGKGFRVAKGELIRITDLQGDQPCDFWAFAAENPREFLSPEHTKPSISKVCPKVGDAAYTNYRRAIVTLVEDNSIGNHDMQFAACDEARYVQLKAPMPHASCQGNLHRALEELGVDFDAVIQPWNLFTNFFILPDGGIEIRPPGTKGGDNIVLRAEMNAFIVVSACPQDMNDTCGGSPTDLRVEVGRG
ncbi:MAG: urea carboxylase-associated family protein [Rhodospirillaceae bacterium]|jgi:uncharacterized protein|nr:urea carboxylase-associated family protein [Rhodospirillaceae bacterium]MBT6116901.1 urea carboxylase-associated family protein [Rhodospirillaceae bacterium]